MSLVNTLRNSATFGWLVDGYGVKGYEGEVVNLVRKIEEKAEDRGLSVSRWATNSTRTGYTKAITWAVHEGERPARTTLLPEGSYTVVLSHTEGSTSRCEAHRKLSELLNSF